MELIKHFQLALCFRNEDRIWNLMRELGDNGSVFSEFSTEFLPDLYEDQIFMYATEKEVVLVMVDNIRAKYEGIVEVADDKIELGVPPAYKSAHLVRTSPVYDLRLAAKALQQVADREGLPKPEIMCVLLTSSYILNHIDMLDFWEKRNVVVYHRMQNFQTNMPIRPARHLPGYSLYKAMCDAVDNGQLHVTPEDDVSEEKEDDFDVNDFIQVDMDNDEYSEKPHVVIQDPIDNPYELLQSLVGLKEVKKHLLDIIDLMKYNKVLQHTVFQAKPHAVSLHAIFSGPVGTGKSTVGRIYGALLHKAGALSRGHVVIAGRGSFIGRQWGCEERNVRAVLKMAQGGVLFIDEAYQLNSSDERDPGRRILPLMLELLADESNRDIAVVLAGYEKPMEGLLSLNWGLESRFPNRLHFSRFSFEELLLITRHRIAEYRYVFTSAARKKYTSLVKEACQNSDCETFSNGRYVANLLEKIYIRHASRCMKANLSGDNLLKITAADVPEAQIFKPRLRIGFGR